MKARLRYIVAAINRLRIYPDLSNAENFLAQLCEKRHYAFAVTIINGDGEQYTKACKKLTDILLSVTADGFPVIYSLFAQCKREDKSNLVKVIMMLSQSFTAGERKRFWEIVLAKMPDGPSVLYRLVSLNRYFSFLLNDALSTQDLDWKELGKLSLEKWDDLSPLTIMMDNSDFRLFENDLFLSALNSEKFWEAIFTSSEEEAEDGPYLLRELICQKEGEPLLKLLGNNSLKAGLGVKKLVALRDLVDGFMGKVESDLQANFLLRLEQAIDKISEERGAKEMSLSMFSLKRRVSAEMLDNGYKRYRLESVQNSNS